MDTQQILAMNAFDASASRDLAAPLAARVKRRADVFGAASVLFYDRPLEFVRGAGCRLYDAAGNAYLDAYNNVQSVGHSHPHVVAAVSRQLAALNVNSRYLHPAIMDCAERLLATMPAELSNITFTCTGSESNDLALRLAMNSTGARGVIVTECAYHGNTALVTDVSPTLCKRGVDSPHVRVVPAPAPGSGADIAQVFAAQVAVAIADLEGSGVGFAALLVDSIFSSDGVFADPPGFLGPAVDVVHAAGGFLIADEVQSGFGRTGSWWGFMRHEVVPDVVSLGKPMGNGYPVGAVITRPEVLARFVSRYGYFNTFAGSPAAAAAAGAVLDVIEQEDLITRAATVGAYLKHRLEALAPKHAAIGAVRGAGLYLGVDLGAGQPAPRLAKEVIEALRDRQVLIGAAGQYGNTLKIRPPLCFGFAEADELVAALDDVLAVKN